jgi:hypothetical protein
MLSLRFVLFCFRVKIYKCLLVFTSFRLRQDRSPVHRASVPMEPLYIMLTLPVYASHHKIQAGTRYFCFLYIFVPIGSGSELSFALAKGTER